MDAGVRPAGAGKSDQAAVVLRPFIAGTRRTDEPDYDQSLSFTTSEQRFRSYQISPNGYLRNIALLIEAVTAGNSAATAFQADAPYNALSSVSFQDTNNQPVVGPMDGFELAMLNKYGGYAYNSDPKASNIYSVTTGAGATGGSFTLVLNVPIEIVARDGLGSQPNKSGSSQFSLALSLNTTSGVYSVAPTNPAAVRVRATLEGWQDPDSNDTRGNPTAQDPPAVQTSQYWHRQSYASLNGAQNVRLQGIDGLVRCLIFIARNAADGVRATADANWPDPFTFKYENSLLFESRIRALWRHWISRHYGYAGTTLDAAGARDAGVYPVWQFMSDYGHEPGAESRFSYLPMSSASNLEINGTFGGNTNLFVLVNKVIPFPQGNVRGLTGGR
jgi:hypothetical protein